MKKRIICLVLGLMMMFSSSLTVLATTESQIRQQKAEAESQLDAANDKIDDLSAKQAAIQAEINEADADLVDLLILIDAAETDIANTEASIVATQAEIEQTQAEIEQTQAELVIAEENKDKQYAGMKTRIRYIYENGGDDAWFRIILEAKDIASLFNRAEYAQSMHAYDRQMLTEFIAVVNQVTALKNSLEEQKATLEGQKATLEAQKASLEAQKADLEARKAELQVRLDQMRATSSDYESQIAAVQAQAAEISHLIAQQEAELVRIEEERRQAEEEARRRAEEERRRAEEEAARREEEASRNEQSGSSSGSGSSSSSSSSSDSYESPGGSSGYDIVAYADQFVGNPYVWGGNSLTNGIDCSHFVYQVLKNCGVYSGGYVTSAGWRSKGRPVASLSEARAGDVICYSGHVAIYDGHGGIVEAKGSKWGITHDRSASHATILAIRRFT